MYAGAFPAITAMRKSAIPVPVPALTGAMLRPPILEAVLPTTARTSTSAVSVPVIPH